MYLVPEYYISVELTLHFCSVLWCQLSPKLHWNAFLLSIRWVRTRWFLLILFWLGWLGMLAGAIVIIIQAPRCKELPEMNWWNEGPLYQIRNMEAFAGAKGLAGWSLSKMLLCHCIACSQATIKNQPLPIQDRIHVDIILFFQVFINNTNNYTYRTPGTFST